MTEMEFSPNMAVFAPEGWEPSQVKAEQPATTYDMFKREILNEIARCLNMPYNIAACNSSGYNYSSGRLDHQTYYKSIRVEQAHVESVVLDRILAAWLAEAVKVFDLGEVGDAPHQWFWDGHEHVDPQKEATAQAQRLASNTTTLATEYARQGKDWETELRQRAKEVTLMKELGLPIEVAKPNIEPATPAEPQDKEDASDKAQRQSQAA
jgi:capsid protein